MVRFELYNLGCLRRGDALRSAWLTGRRWEECIEVALANKLAERAAKRELEAKQANKEIEEFTNDFKNAARKCFQMIDKDGGGTLSTMRSSRP